MRPDILALAKSRRGIPHGSKLAISQFIFTIQKRYCNSAFVVMLHECISIASYLYCLIKYETFCFCSQGFSRALEFQHAWTRTQRTLNTTEQSLSPTRTFSTNAFAHYSCYAVMLGCAHPAGLQTHPIRAIDIPYHLNFNT